MIHYDQQQTGVVQCNVQDGNVSNSIYFHYQDSIFAACAQDSIFI